MLWYLFDNGNIRLQKICARDNNFAGHVQPMVYFKTAFDI